MIAGRASPRTRIRINHTKTVSRGWEHETTVEVEWEGTGGSRDEDQLARLAGLLAEADAVGGAESERRNAKRSATVRVGAAGNQTTRAR